MPGTPARAAHGSSHTEQMVADGQRDRIAKLHVSPRAPQPVAAAERRTDRPESSVSDQLAADYVLADRSTVQSRKRITAALSMPCPVCAAARGAFCFEHAQGLCIERYLKGSRTADAALRPGDLEHLAAAVRNAEHHQRQRAEPEAAERGGRR